jgi:hypothetical protein
MDREIQVEVSRYLASLKSDHGLQEHKTKYTLNRPHSCSYCSLNVIDGNDYQNQAGLDQWEEDVVVPLCGDLTEAVQASKAGCALYEWFLRILSKHHNNHRFQVRLEDIVDARFTLRFSHRGGIAVYPSIWLKTKDNQENVLDHAVTDSWLAAGAREGG